MSQSLNKIYIHIVFSTRHRRPLIFPPIEAELHAYLGGICNELECQAIKIGGYHNHVHILCMLSKKVTVSKLIEEIKCHSSKWIKTKGSDYENFYWQEGYGVFSVNPRDVDSIISYIANQQEHHARIEFENEFRKFLKDNEMEFDERYVWD